MVRTLQLTGHASASGLVSEDVENICVIIIVEKLPINFHKGGMVNFQLVQNKER